MTSRPPLFLFSIATGSPSLLSLAGSRLRQRLIQVTEERQYFAPLLFVFLFGSVLTTAILFTAILVAG